MSVPTTKARFSKSEVENLVKKKDQSLSYVKHFLPQEAYFGMNFKKFWSLMFVKDSLSTMIVVHC